MSRSKKDNTEVTEDDGNDKTEEISGLKTKRISKVKSDAEKREQRDKLNEQLKKFDEKILFHREKFETITAKKRLLENKLKKL